MRRLTELNASKWTLAVLAGGMFTLMLALNILTPYICDDYTYNLNFYTRQPLGALWEIFESMYAHSYKMNGRLISHGLMQVFMLLPSIVFDTVNAAVFTGTLWLVLRLSGGGRNGLLFAALFCLVWLWVPVFGQVVLWQVGALNYFWSLSTLVLYTAPALLRFRENRELLKTKWHHAAFCVYGFFFGWYSEMASFVGMCLVVCLLLLDVWMNRRKFEIFRLLPVLSAVLGYAAMLSMPAQAANKQGAGLTMELLGQRFDACTGMLTQYLALPLSLFALLFLLGLLVHLPRKTMILAGLLALAGVCANYMPLAASYYPERCLCVPVWMLLMASTVLAAPLSLGKGFPIFCGACCLVLLLTLPAGLRGCRDIVSCHLQNSRREETIAAALETGESDVIANVVVPTTPWSGFYGVRDLTDDPETWPNHAMAVYYGLDSLTAE